MSYPNYPGNLPQPGYPPSNQYPGYPPSGPSGAYSPYPNSQPVNPPIGFNSEPGYPHSNPLSFIPGVPNPNPYLPSNPASFIPGVPNPNPYPPSNPGSFIPGVPNPNPYPPSNPGSFMPGAPTPSPYPSPNPGYPSSGPGHPFSAPGYPSSAPGYPSSAPGYPSSAPGYPSSAPGYPSSAPGYPSPAPGHPSSAPGHPSSAPGYPPSNAAHPPTNPHHAPSVGPARDYSPPLYPSLPTDPIQQSYDQPQHQQHLPQKHQPQHAPSMPSPMQQDIPTVYAKMPFDPRADAEALHKAMKGLGTDEKGLIAVLCHRPVSQREAIVQAYKSGFGKDLKSKIKSETSGNFERLLVALIKSKAEYLASEMYNAVSGLGTQEGTLIEILVSGNNQLIRDTAVAYKNKYGHSMEKDIKGDTSGTLKMLLVSLAQGNRDENTPVDIAKAREDAQRLYQAGEAKLGTDESTFNAILATRSWAQICQIMTEYQRMHGNSLEKVVASEFSANAEKGLLAILRCARSPSSYFAERLHRAISGAGTRDGCLIRIIVTHCDTDLGNIKREYEKQYGRSLAADVSNDTSGDYKKGLLALIGQ